MSEVEYVGNMYADGHVTSGGDRANLANYKVTCGCGHLLGFIANWREKDGRRTALCVMCEHFTVLSGTSVEAVHKYIPACEEEAAKIRSLREEALKVMGEKARERDAFLKQLKAH